MMKRIKLFSLFTLLILFPLFVFAQDSPVIADGAELIEVDDSFVFTEGPIADDNGNVYFTDQPNNRIYKWDANTNTIDLFMENAGRANGLYFDNEGNLIAAADEKNELWSITPNGEVTVLLDEFEGKKLNGPNDIWVAPNGGIYFTDPYYHREWWTRTEPDIKEQRVYYLSPDRTELSVVADQLVKPNGIIGTPDGKTLYIADIGDSKTYSYTINPDGTLKNRSLVLEEGSDGMTLDELGNIYITGDGVTIYSADGEFLQHIDVPKGWTSNVTFGGPDNSTLFITALEAVYTLPMNVKGASL